MSLKNKIDEIKSYLGRNNILSEAEECYCYAEDASNLIKPDSTPELVVFPETAEEVQKIVKYANEHNIPIIPRGAGTNMVGSCVCNNGGIVINFANMNKIREINTTDMTATVEPGVILGDLKNEVEKVGLFFPPDPSNYKVSTVGGAISQSSGGAFGLKYGTTKDYVLSLKVVTARGELITLGAETTKDSAGYHLVQLMVGSEGTLAVIVEATLKLIQKPEAVCACSAYFDSIDAGVSAVNEIFQNKLAPAAIDFMDKNAICTVEDYAKCGLITTKDCLLLISVDGYEASINYQTEKLVNVLKIAGACEIKVSKNADDVDKIWGARRVSFAATARLAPDVVTDDIIVPRSSLVSMVRYCQHVAEKYHLKMCMVGHAGDGNIHPQIALNLESEEEYKNYMDAKAEMYKAAIDFGGTISAEHGVGLEKKSYLGQVLGIETMNYMKMIKKIFDPNNILNPEKIL